MLIFIDFEYLKNYSDSDFLEIYEATGCPVCNWVGYLGRTMIAEVLIFDNYLKELSENNLPTYKIRQLLRKKRRRCF
jgi:type II secretory ATPase GspE/PulE/Tfp pilus assembly ATPase PilB-like protein